MCRSDPLNDDLPRAGCFNDRIDKTGSFCETPPTKDQGDCFVKHIVACIDTLTCAAEGCVVLSCFGMPRILTAPEGNPAPCIYEGRPTHYDLAHLLIAVQFLLNFLSRNRLSGKGTEDV